jgi:hypothetical protein
MFRGDLVADAQQFVDIVTRPDAQDQDAQRMAQRLLDQAKRAGDDQRASALAILADAISTAPVRRAAYLALVAGAFIEVGTDPTVAGAPILARLMDAITLALPFQTACAAALMEARRDAQAASTSQKDANEGFDQQAIDAVQAQVSAQMPENAGAWNALDFLESAALAVLSRSKTLRKRGHEDQALRNAVASLRSHDFMCLDRMLQVLDDEPVIVLHPSLKRGYQIKISGIGDNFQLHTLLADALIGDESKGWLPGKRPDAEVAALARGALFNPEKTSAADGAFNMLNWYGLGADGVAVEGQSSSDAWIWNEGIPADIAPFEDTRVILLTPPPYARSWNAGRFFPSVVGELEVTRQLSTQEVNDWLARLAAAPHPQVNRRADAVE